MAVASRSTFGVAPGDGHENLRGWVDSLNPGLPPPRARPPRGSTVTPCALGAANRLLVPSTRRFV